ncbi:MAG: hypothetical protein MUO34_06785 [Ignavibacteriaceae bacterium]|nr:hypothetical protein [Ignavibacteriaceae bacterium]
MEATFKTIKIGKQVWMAENLNINVFRNGDLIGEAKSDEEWQRARESERAAWCYYNNNPENSKKYGNIYNWYAAVDPRGLTPEGWHLPNKKEFDILLKNCGGKESVFGSLIPGGSSGFNTIFGGWRDGYGDFSKLEKRTVYCSSTQVSDDATCAYYLGIFNDIRDVYLDYFNKGFGFSIRLLKD